MRVLKMSEEFKPTPLFIKTLENTKLQAAAHELLKMNDQLRNLVNEYQEIVRDRDEIIIKLTTMLEEVLDTGK